MRMTIATHGFWSSHIYLFVFTQKNIFYACCCGNNYVVLDYELHVHVVCIDILQVWCYCIPYKNNTYQVNASNFLPKGSI